MGRFYGKEGQRLDLMEWAKLMEDASYTQIALTKNDVGIVVSTVWLGLDSRIPDNEGLPPLIFETAVFLEGMSDRERLDGGGRYATLAEAKDAHAAEVLAWAKRPEGG